MRTSLRSRPLAVVTLAFAAGCSIVNSLDELKEPNDGKFTGDTRPVATVSIDDAGFGPPPVADSGGDANNGQAFSPLVVGGEAPAGDGGALAPVLTVLDSNTGQERGQREKMWVAGIAYEARRDLWYIFEGASYFIPQASETVKIRIRKLDATSGAWTELGVFEGAPLAYYDAIAVTRERISYVAHPADGKTSARLITVNTSDVAHPILNAEVELGSAAIPKGLTGTPSKSGPGGNVNVMYVASGADCADGGAECPARIARFLLPNGSTPQRQPVDNLVGGMSSRAVPAYGSLGCAGGGDDVIVMPNVSNDGTMVLGTYGATDSQDNGTQTFKMAARASLLRRLGVDETRKMVFVVEANADTKLYAVPIGGTALPAVNLGHSGQSVYYDPSSSTVFAPFNQGEGKTFSPYHVSPDGKTLVERTGKTADNQSGDWNPPDDLRPNVLGIHRLAPCE